MKRAARQPRVAGRRLASAVLIAQTLSASAFAAPDKPRELSGAEIRTVFAGKIITDGFHWSTYLIPDGSAKSVELGRSNKGRWKVSGNELCVSIPAGAAFHCRTVVRSGTAFVFRANGQDLYEFTVEAPSTKYRFD